VEHEYFRMKVTRQGRRFVNHSGRQVGLPEIERQKDLFNV